MPEQHPSPAGTHSKSANKTTSSIDGKLGEQGHITHNPGIALPAEPPSTAESFNGTCYACKQKRKAWLSGHINYDLLEELRKRIPTKPIPRPRGVEVLSMDQFIEACQDVRGMVDQGKTICPRDGCLFHDASRQRGASLTIAHLMGNQHGPNDIVKMWSQCSEPNCGTTFNTPNTRHDHCRIAGHEIGLERGSLVDWALWETTCICMPRAASSGGHESTRNKDTSQSAIAKPQYTPGGVTSRPELPKPGFVAVSELQSAWDQVFKPAAPALPRQPPYLRDSYHQPDARTASTSQWQMGRGFTTNNADSGLSVPLTSKTKGIQPSAPTLKSVATPNCNRGAHRASHPETSASTTVGGHKSADLSLLRPVRTEFDVNQRSKQFTSLDCCYGCDQKRWIRKSNKKDVNYDVLDELARTQPAAVPKTCKNRERLDMKSWRGCLAHASNDNSQRMHCPVAGCDWHVGSERLKDSIIDHLLGSSHAPLPILMMWSRCPCGITYASAYQCTAHKKTCPRAVDQNGGDMGVWVANEVSCKCGNHTPVA